MPRRKKEIQAVKEFWQKVMDDEEVNIQHRLKASELCAKLSQENESEVDKVVVFTGEKDIKD